MLQGRVVHELWHDVSMKGAAASKRSVISTVLECSTREEWCSAGGDGKSCCYIVFVGLTLQASLLFGGIRGNRGLLAVSK